MNLVMKDPMTTVENGYYLNLMKRCLKIQVEAEGFSTPGRQRSYHGTDTLVGRLSGDERRA